MNCPMDSEPMTLLTAESTALRSVYRCFKHRIWRSRRTGLSWALFAANPLIFLMTGTWDISNLIDFGS